MMKKRLKKKKANSPHLFHFLNNRDNCQSWDYANLECLELAKLRDLKLYFDKRLYATDEYYDEILHWLNICIRVAECFMENKHWSDDKHVNVRNCKDRFLVELYAKEKDREPHYIGNHLIDSEKITRKEIWESKCRHLYYKIREYHTQEWSD